MATNGDTEKKLWDIANNLRANSELSSARYSIPVFGLIFLPHADIKFTKKQKDLESKTKCLQRQIGTLDYQAECSCLFNSFLDLFSNEMSLIHLTNTKNQNI